MRPLILASTSPYRKIQLESLMIPFTCEKPNCDEDSFKKLEPNPLKLAILLARKKAESLNSKNRVIIGGDQLVNLNGKILGKPGTEEKAFIQLKEMQNQVHELITAICVVANDKAVEFHNVTRIKLKKLEDKQIQSYLSKDTPWDCAGSYKIEKHGMALIETLETDDFTSIQGLPLLQLSKVLHNLGYEIPKATS